MTFFQRRTIDLAGRTQVKFAGCDLVGFMRGVEIFDHLSLGHVAAKLSLDLACLLQSLCDALFSLIELFIDHPIYEVAGYRNPRATTTRVLFVDPDLGVLTVVFEPHITHSSILRLYGAVVVGVFSVS